MNDLTLYHLSDHLTALLETQEACPLEQAAELETEIATYAAAEVAKVDQFAGYLRQLDAAEDFCKQREAEIKRRREQIVARRERLEKYAVAVIEAKPRIQTTKGEVYAKLEGKESVMSLRVPVQHVEITDEAAVPSEYKILTITIPALDWEKHHEELEEGRGIDEWSELSKALLLSVLKATCSVDKKAIKEAIDDGEDVPGAEMKYGEPSLIRPKGTK